MFLALMPMKICLKMSRQCLKTKKVKGGAMKIFKCKFIFTIPFPPYPAGEFKINMEP